MIPTIRGLSVLSQIGNGAGSVVFKAREDSTGAIVAVKSVTRDIVDEIQKLAPAPEYSGATGKLFRLYVRQVRNEWSIGHRLTNLAGGHVGIPRMHRLIVDRAFLTVNGVHLVMDFVDGQNLRRDHGHTVPQLIQIYRQAADVLRFLHQNNVVHADMKPHHIIIDKSGRVQLLDLGLACHRTGHRAKVVGSPDYMAPEQLAGAGVDERTDVFGLGATMFWAFTGHSIRPLVAGASTLGAVDFQTTNFETSLRKYNPDVPVPLEEIILRSCAPSRRARLTLPEIIARLDKLM